jgi:hypothetical protein
MKPVMVSTATSGNRVFPTKAEYPDLDCWENDCLKGYEPIEDYHARYGNGVDARDDPSDG